MYAHTKTTQLVAFTSIAAVTLGICHVVPTALADRPNRPPPDTTPPAAVTTLAAAMAAQGAVHLTWTAVGDDGGAGTAAAYDVRYSIVAPADPPFNGNVSAWFAAAVPASAEPAPRSSGWNESFCLGGLSDGVVYHVALKVADEAGNTSVVSNVATAAAGALVGDVMHVSDVSAGGTFGAQRRRPIAIVTIQDEFGAPVMGATVTVAFSGCTNETGLIGVTDCNGRVRIEGNRTTNCSNTPCCIIVAVSNVSHAGLLYEPSSNLQNCDSGQCNVLGGPPCEPCE